MTTRAEINADSVGLNGVRLTTMVVTFPRFILPEFNTHRAFSRNGASSRAIPVAKQLSEVLTNPFIPTAFNKNAKGMQGGEPVDEAAQIKAEVIWLAARDSAIKQAEKLASLGISKQYTNRLLEPFMYTTMVVTGVAEAYSNFFALRYHKDAQPEINQLAKLMWEAYQASTPVKLGIGDWHLPFIEESEKVARWDRWKSNPDLAMMLNREIWAPLIIRSVARCARVSYLNHDKTTPSFDDDYKLYKRLIGSTPGHWSPAEHQAQTLEIGEYCVDSGNLRGWRQYRKTLKGEYITTFKEPLG